MGAGSLSRFFGIMGCDFPIPAYRSQEINPATGKSRITFNPKHARNSQNFGLMLPCGRCMGCKLEKSKQWAIRCDKEAQLHEENCFLTLTFSNAHLPVDYSVHPRHMQLFMKKLRKFICPKKVRFYLGAEYGEENLRPHYHVILFGHDFNDKIFYERTTRGDTLYTSRNLSTLWPYGLSTIGAVTFESAGYTARYSTKKITGPMASDFYLRVHPLHGFICRVRPEFSLMSRRPGIGHGYAIKYQEEIRQSDSVIVRGRELKPPRFFDQQLSEEEQLKLARERKAKSIQRPKLNNRNRSDKQEVRNARISTLKRKL